MIRLLLSFLKPLSLIARDLATIAQLYELDLASRDKPIYRMTQSPTRDDTEISYSGEDVPKGRSRIKRWLSGAEEDELVGE